MLQSADLHFENALKSALISAYLRCKDKNMMMWFTACWLYLSFLLIFQQGSIGSGGSSSNSSGSTEEGPLDATLTTHFTNAGVAVLEASKDGPSQHADRSKRYIVEHVDLGAYYYRKYFYLRGEKIG